MLIPAAPPRSTELVAAIAALVVGGFAQELLLLGGHPELGVLIIVPLVILVAWLWRPSPPVLGIIGVSLGIELLLPLQTGGGRYQDWFLHYQMALHYAGRPNHVLAQALRWRTPLYHQLNASILSYSPGYWTFQVGSVLLCSLWLWPAALLIRDRAPESTGLRLMAVALAPIVIAYSTYTWPWNFASFFLLSSLWLQGQVSLIARVGVGLALAAALLAHPATAGYVLGLGVVWLYRHRTAVLPGVAATALVLASVVPWVATVGGNQSPNALITNSVPAIGGTSPYLWAISRLLLVAHTFLPEPVYTNDRFWATVVLTFLLLSLPGALVTLLVTGRLPRPPAAILICLAAGAAAITGLYNASSFATGMLDALYPGVLILLTFAAVALDVTRVRRMFVVAVVLGGCFVALLFLVSSFPIAGDSNVTFRSQYSVIFFVQRWGLLPGIVVVAVAIYLCARSAFTDWQQAPLGATAE